MLDHTHLNNQRTEFTSIPWKYLALWHLTCEYGVSGALEQHKTATVFNLHTLVTHVVDKPELVIIGRWLPILNIYFDIVYCGSV